MYVCVGDTVKQKYRLDCRTYKEREKTGEIDYENED